MRQPLELSVARPILLHDGVTSTTTDVWETLVAGHDGDLARVRRLVDHCPALATCQYDYTSPLHLAVREGHLEVVQFLVQRGGIDPAYRTHPFLESLPTVAHDRGLHAIEAFLTTSLADPALLRPKGDTARIERGHNEDQRAFQDAVDRGDYAAVEAFLRDRPFLATDPDLFWGEGVLSAPANANDRQMVDLLLRYGASVPTMSKWPKEYYVKHLDMAAHLLANGMDPNHHTWRNVTLLHDLCFKGTVEKVRLLLDHGAATDRIDDEFRSTPLGLAARQGREDVVALLLERGASVRAAGADWATPLAWARSRNHTAVVETLVLAGA
ncbi:MAG: ankyrin repeat domain-containing protein [Gemmatimonadetes bacterium]|nr:ankyrin repeat domain-containing protein [Gemmatimonadota bacterium]